MFESAVPLHIKSVTMATETRNDVTSSIVKVGLVLEPLTRKLARELSSDIADHCFTKDGAIREIEQLTFKLREPQQHVAAKMATDVDVNTVLRHARPVGLTVTKRGEKDGDEAKTKSKKVSPGQPVLRARLDVLVDPNDAAVREFLMCRYGTTFYFEFQDEERQLDFGSDDEGEDDEAPQQGKLKMAPTPDPDAGDVLEEGERAPGDETRILKVLSDIGIETTRPYLAGLSDDHFAQLVEYARVCEEVNARPNPSAADIPPAPKFLFKPGARKAVQQLAKILEAPAAKKAKAPRRSSAQFKNNPKLAGKVTKAKGKRKAASH